MKQKNQVRGFLTATSLALVSGLISLPVWAQTNYSAFELNREENWAPLITQDMNGDGLKDLVYSYYNSQVGRELHILHQRENGSFPSEPQRIEIKTEIIAVSFADLRPEPGMELLLYAGAGVFSLSSKQEGYTGNLKPLLQWDLIATVPDLEQVQFINVPQDINGDGFVDLLLPGVDDYGLFLGGPNETFSLSGRFDTKNSDISNLPRTAAETEMDARLGINAEQGVIIDVSISNSSPFADFVEQWEDSPKSDRDLFRSDIFTPSVLLAQLSDDSLLDAMYLTVGADGLGQINIHFQNPQSQYSAEPDWTGSLDTRGELQLADINGDGLDDLVVLSGNGDDYSARMYLNQDGLFDFESPNQVMRFSGYDVRLNFVTIDPSSKPALSVNYYTIPVVDAIRSASLNRVQIIYGSDQVEGNQVFNRRPSTRFEETFSATNVLGLSEQMTLAYDVNGDKKADALYVTENGTLAAKSVNADLTLSESPFWEYISPRTVFEFEVLALNDDDLPDLILRHGTTTSVLVARP